MIEKERSAGNPRSKVNTGQPNQRVYTKVTKNIKPKELEDPQENNKYVKPTSTRQSVEVDKITELLKSSSATPTPQSSKEKQRKERIDSIVNDIPKNFSNDDSTNNSPKEQKTIEEEKTSQDTKEVEQKHMSKPADETLKAKETPPSKKEEVPTAQTQSDLKEEPIKDDKEPSSPIVDTQPRSNFLNYILVIAVLVMGFFTYKNSSNNANPSFKDLSKAIQDQYVLKNETTKTINGNLKFNHLPNKIQEQYVLKDEIVKSQKHANMLIKKSRLLNDQNMLLKKQIESLKLENMNAIKITKSQNKNRNLLKENALLKKEQEVYSNKIVSYKIASKKDKKQIDTLLNEKKKLKEEILNLEQLQSKTNKILPVAQKESVANNNYAQIVKNEVFPAVKSTSKDYKLVKCYDLKPGVFYLSPTCKTDITKFLKDNADAKRFEIIGVVDQKDFTTLTDDNPAEKKTQELQKYSSMGLARYRVLETSWLITEVLGNETVLSPVNYTITSKKNNRGSIIRAYYK